MTKTLIISIARIILCIPHLIILPVASIAHAVARSIVNIGLWWDRTINRLLPLEEPSDAEQVERFVKTLTR